MLGKRTLWRLFWNILLLVSTPIAALTWVLASAENDLSIGVLALASISVGAVLSFAVARRFSRPLEEIHRGAEALMRGDGAPKLPVSDSFEIGGLADTVNRIAIARDEHARDASRGLQELDAALSSLDEGVLVVDIQGRVTRVNHAAASLVDASEEALVDASYSDVVAHPGLRSLIREALAGSEGFGKELVFGSDERRYVEARSTPVHDRFGRITGVVVALDDRTRLRNLASLRRDFAAHVSHELKTPLTAIKGFADTLLRGALADPRDAEHFVKVIAKQTDRLHELVESLMELARVEGQVESDAIDKTWHHVGDLLRAAVSELDGRREFPIHVDCPTELTARVSATLLERAIGNLVDNAMRYAGAGCAAWVSAREDAGDVVITVRDDGEGIEEADRARIFERFYRVSRTRGQHPEGSGLGLAIVKHVVLAHGGTVSAESEPGRGTTFALRIPKY